MLLNSWDHRWEIDKLPKRRDEDEEMKEFMVTMSCEELVKIQNSFIKNISSWFSHVFKGNGRTFKTGRNHLNDSVWEKFPVRFFSTNIPYYWIQENCDVGGLKKDQPLDPLPNVYIPVDLHRFKLSQEFPMNYLIPSPLRDSPFR